MSSPKLPFELSELAKQDFRDLLSYTMQKWGERQFILYREIIDNALATISRGPGIGRDVDDKSGACVYPAGKHMIFYQVEQGRIQVLRILHARMQSSSLEQ